MSIIFDEKNVVKISTAMLNYNPYKSKGNVFIER